MTATTSDTSRRVFIAPVAEPVNGAWHDLSDFSDLEDVLEVARKHIVGEHEELDCSDYEGFGGLFKGNHYVSPEAAWEAHELLTDCEDAGVDVEVALAYIDNLGRSGALPSVEDIRDAYQGTFGNLAEYAEQTIGDIYDLRNVPDIILNYIDYEAIGRDLELGGDVWTAEVSDGVAVFNNH